MRTTYLLEWIMSDSLRRTVHKGTTKIERHHKFAKHLGFGGDGLFRTNDPADEEKIIVSNELVANAVALQTVVDQTQALHALKSKGVSIDLADLAFLSPYPTSKLKRFGDYPTNLTPEAMPITTGASRGTNPTQQLRSVGAAIGFTGGKRNRFLRSTRLPHSNIRKNRIHVMMQRCRVLLSPFARFFNDWIFPHERENYFSKLLALQGSRVGMAFIKLDNAGPVCLVVYRAMSPVS